MTNISSDVLRKIEEALATDRPLNALVYFELSPAAPAPAVVALAKSLVQLCGAATGLEPSRMVVLSQMRGCSLEGPAAFVQAFVALPQVRSFTLR